MSKKDAVRSKHLIQKQKKRRFFLSIIFFVLLFTFVGGFYYVSNLPFVRIVGFVVQGNSVVPSESVISIARELTLGKYLYSIPKDSIFFYPSRAISEKIKKSFDRVSMVELDIKSWRTLRISVFEYEPHALLCQKQDIDNQDTVIEHATTSLSVGTSTIPVLAKTKEQCYFLDKFGYIFDSSPNYSDSVYIKYFNKNKSFNRGDNFVSLEDFKNIDTFLTSLRGLGLSIVTVEDLGDKYFEAYALSGTKILFTTRTSLDNSYVAVSAFLSDKTLFPKGKYSYDILSLLDVRSSQKILFKMKE